MGVGAGLYMYVVVVQTFTFAIWSADEFLYSNDATDLHTARRVAPQHRDRRLLWRHIKQHDAAWRVISWFDGDSEWVMMFDDVYSDNTVRIVVSSVTAGLVLIALTILLLFYRCACSFICSSAVYFTAWFRAKRSACYSNVVCHSLYFMCMLCGNGWIRVYPQNNFVISSSSCGRPME